MEFFYIALFLVQAVVAGYLEINNVSRKESKHGEAPKEFLSFRNNYLVVYSMMMAGDWLQGPYVYALYEAYGFSRGDIGRLFIAGFGSSMIFGTIVGSLADKHGRKRAALTYVASYTFGCCTKHFNSFWVLFMGRIFCGVATSLLYSAFESWLVAEHFKRNFASDWLSATFSQAVFLGNGLMAILSGLFAHSLVETFALGPVAPFDAAATVLLVGGAIIYFTWPENYGDASHRNKNQQEIFKKAFDIITGDPKIALLGAMQALFEGSMYTFVFLWTPALSPNGEKIPHGMVFACFMISCMVGSAYSGKLLSKSSTVKPEKFMQAVFGLSSLCLIVPVLLANSEADIDGTGGITFSGKLQLIAFCAFEALVGIFWPSMMTLRSQHVPEEIRSTIINFFRIPLNLFVCVVLYNVSSLPLSAMFGMCSFFLLVCLVCMQRFAAITGAAERLAADRKTPIEVQDMNQQS
jgi:MFS family permease